MASEMLERMARALAVAWFTSDADDFETKDQASGQWLGFVSMARAVAQSMREPDETILALGKTWSDDPRIAWQSQIDQILGEG